MMVTVFTPTYNRGNLLPKLFHSLCDQSCDNFEWIIVDDGSSDNTAEYINKISRSAKFPIRYIHQENRGKHTAINRGVAQANGELFIIIDSDDLLLPDAIENIVDIYNNAPDKPNIGGICGVMQTPGSEIVGGQKPYTSLVSNSIEIRYKYNITGDLAEVFRTSVLRKFPFPEYEGEKFCPEALIWNRIARKHKLYFINTPLCIREYLPGGLTSKITRIRRKSPMAAMTYYSELYHYDIPVGQRIKAAINFWRFAPAKYYSKVKGFGMLNRISLAAWLPGVLMRLNDSRE